MSFGVVPLLALLKAELGLAILNGLASAIGYAIPVGISSLLGGPNGFDWRECAVAFAVGAFFGSIPNILGATWVGAAIKGIVANEAQYIISSLVMGKEMTEIGHLTSLVTGGIVCGYQGATMNPNLDDLMMGASDYASDLAVPAFAAQASDILDASAVAALRNASMEFERSAFWEITSNLSPMVTEFLYNLNNQKF